MSEQCLINSPQRDSYRIDYDSRNVPLGRGLVEEVGKTAKEREYGNGVVPKMRNQFTFSDSAYRSRKSVGKRSRICPLEM